MAYMISANMDAGFKDFQIEAAIGKIYASVGSFLCVLTLSQMANFRLFQLKQVADDNFKLNENGREFSKWVENTASNFSFSCSVFKRLVQQTRKNQGFFGKGLNDYTPASRRGGVYCFSSVHPSFCP